MMNIKNQSIDYLREKLIELNEKNNTRIEKRMSKIGINKISLPKSSLIFGIILVNLIDRQNNTHYINNKPLHLAWSLMNKIGDIAESLDQYTDEEHIFLAFATIKQAKNMDETQIRNMSLALSIAARWIINSNPEDLTNFAWNLVNEIKMNINSYPNNEINQKREIINNIILNGKPNSQKDAIRILRYALSALPSCDLEFADIVIWQLIQIYGLWNNINNEIRIPVTNSLLRPLTELGFINYKDIEMLSKEELSALIGKISIKFFPETPHILSALELVGKYWCLENNKHCSTCPLYVVCPRLI